MQQSIMMARVGFVQKVKEVWSSDEPRVSRHRRGAGGVLYAGCHGCSMVVAMVAGGSGGGSAGGQLLGRPGGSPECAQAEEVGGATILWVWCGVTSSPPALQGPVEPGPVHSGAARG